MIGLRVGPFEITDGAAVPDAGVWYRARRAGTARRGADVWARIDGEARATVQQQYDVLRAVDDPRTPSALGWFEGVGALVVEAPEGASLQLLVDRAAAGAPTDDGTVADLVVDLCELLERAHQRNLPHGALEPARVWLAKDARLVVWGFGGDLAPTPAWTPPERRSGGRATATHDQWALGALALSLVTGRPPTELEADLSSLDRRGSAIGRVVRRMLEPHPSHRYPAITAARADWLGIARRATPSRRREIANDLGAAPVAVAMAIDAPPPAPPPPRPEAVALAAPEAEIELEPSEETPVPAGPTLVPRPSPVQLDATPVAPPVRRPPPRARATAPDDEDSMTNEATALYESAILGRLERPTESGMSAPKPAPPARTASPAARLKTPVPTTRTPPPAIPLAAPTPSLGHADDESTRVLGADRRADPDAEITHPPDVIPLEPGWAVDGVTDPSGSEMMSEEVLKAALAATPAPEAPRIEPAVIRDDLETIPPSEPTPTPMIVRVAPWAALVMLLGLMALTVFNLMRA